MSIETDWPGDSARVTRWARAAMQRAAEEEFHVDGLDRVRVAAQVAGNDLEELSWDATGAALKIHPRADAGSVRGRASVEAEPDVLRRTGGVARSVRLIARPVRIHETPITFDLQLHDVPIHWIVTAEPAVAGDPETMYGIEPDEDGDTADMRGTVSFAIETNDIAPLITSVIRPALKGTGFSLGRLAVDIDQDGADGIRVQGRAGGRWRLMLASARFDARLQIARDGVITVRALRVGSGNPLVALGLLAARSQVRSMIGRSYDLNQELKDGQAGLRIHDLRVSAGHQLSVTARLGQA